MSISKTPLNIENVVTLPSININGHKIIFEPIRGEDVAAISNLYLHNYIADQTLFRALGVGERLRQALATPDAQESQAFLRETHEYIMGILIGPSIASVPIVSVKAVCETTGELIGVSLGNAESVAESHWFKTKDFSACPIYSSLSRASAELYAAFDVRGRLASQESYALLDRSSPIEQTIVHSRSLAIARQWRGTGLARKLLECWIAMCRAAGAAGMLTLATNPRVMHMCSSVGFELVSEIDFRTVIEREGGECNPKPDDPKSFQLLWLPIPRRTVAK